MVEIKYSPAVQKLLAQAARNAAAQLDVGGAAAKRAAELEAQKGKAPSESIIGMPRPPPPPIEISGSELEELLGASRPGAQAPVAPDSYHDELVGDLSQLCNDIAQELGLANRAVTALKESENSSVIEYATRVQGEIDSIFRGISAAISNTTLIVFMASATPEQIDAAIRAIRPLAASLIEKREQVEAIARSEGLLPPLPPTPEQEAAEEAARKGAAPKPVKLAGPKKKRKWPTVVFATVFGIGVAATALDYHTGYLGNWAATPTESAVESACRFAHNAYNFVTETVTGEKTGDKKKVIVPQQVIEAKAPQEEVAVVVQAKPNDGVYLPVLNPIVTGAEPKDVGEPVQEVQVQAAEDKQGVVAKAEPKKEKPILKLPPAYVEGEVPKAEKEESGEVAVATVACTTLTSTMGEALDGMKGAIVDELYPDSLPEEVKVVRATAFVNKHGVVVSVTGAGYNTEGTELKSHVLPNATAAVQDAVKEVLGDKKPEKACSKTIKIE